MNKIRKVVIPVAGFGTRFYPITKSISKEMMPIIDEPTIQILIKEALKAGIEEVIIVNNKEKKLVNHYFSRDDDLNRRLLEMNKEKAVKQLEELEHLAKIKFVYQEGARGLGEAVLCAKEAVGNEAFAVMLGDDIMINRGGKPVVQQLIEEYYKTGKTIVASQEVKDEDVSKYGIVDPKKIAGRLVEMGAVKEKPSSEEAKSNIACLGCYVLTPKIFDLLETQEKGVGGEIQLTDAIGRLIPIEGVYAYKFEGERFDVGDKFGYITAIVDFALHDERFKDKLEDYLDNLKKER